MTNPLITIVKKTKLEILEILEKIPINEYYNNSGTFHYDFYVIFPYFTILTESNAI